MGAMTDYINGVKVAYWPTDTEGEYEVRAAGLGIIGSVQRFTARFKGGSTPYWEAIDPDNESVADFLRTRREAVRRLLNEASPPATREV